jgi:hypothetical protein
LFSIHFNKILPQTSECKDIKLLQI